MDAMRNMISTYAAYSLNQEERLASSSGGIFSLLAKAILSADGAVYGVALSADCRKAEFMRATDESGLAKLRSSKYFQASVGDTFIRVKRDLDKGKKVLFSGTACQINGLTGYLSAGQSMDRVREKYPGLYCIDVICHGAPSPALWRKYADFIEKGTNAHLIRINFRCKNKNWPDFWVKKTDKKHRAMFISKNADPFMRMFLADYCLRPSCYECRAKENKRSDITIGDFWGVKSVAPEMDDGNGASLILVRTERGKELLDSVKDQIRILEVSYEDGVRRNPSEYGSAARPSERDTFFDDMAVLTFDELKNKYVPSSPRPLKERIRRRIKSEAKKILISAGFSGRIHTTGCNTGYGLWFVFRNGE